MAGLDLKRWIALVEAAAPWGVTRSSIFDQSLISKLVTFPDLKEKLAKFVQVKLENPLVARYGKHDRPFTGAPLKGFSHCHLRDDAILIYTLANRCLNLVCVVNHADIEGKRMKAVAKRLNDLPR